MKVRDWEASKLDVLMVPAGDTLRLETIRPSHSGDEPAESYTLKSLYEAIVEDPGEWREGTSPSRSVRTVRDSLPSYGSHSSALG